VKGGTVPAGHRRTVFILVWCQI